MKYLLILLFPTLSLANQCVLQDRTVTSSEVKIVARSNIQRQIVPAPDGGRRCVVNFQAQINNAWYWANGHYDWDGARPAAEACAVAISRAEDAVKTQVAPSHVRSEKVLTCSDNEDLEKLQATNPGTVAPLHKYRPHPKYPNEFWHNGAKCRWFLDSVFREKDIYTYQGIICKVANSQWVVVDKF